MPILSRFRWKRMLLRWTLFLATLWVIAMLFFKALENTLVYPASKAAQSWSEPGDPSTQEVWLTSADGTEIHARYLPCEGAIGAIHFSHGNGGNLSHRDDRMHLLRDTFRRSVLIYDYPGYGKSAGRPTEAGVYGAGDAAWAWLKEKYPADRIVLMGESLGGGVAVELATRGECEGVVLFSTFESLPKAAKAKFPFLPCETLMSNRFDNAAKMPAVRVPVFISHGTADEVIPIEHAKRMFEAAREPKRFRARPDGTHNMPFDSGICGEARDFLAECAERSKRSAP